MLSRAFLWRSTGAVLLMAACALGQAAEPAATASSAAVAATLKRDSARCRSQSDLDACYDAVRRNPGDATLIVALADALARAKRPGDALRAYRRAADLAPHTAGLAAKISAVEGQTAGNRPPLKSQPPKGGGERNPVRRFSNAAPDGLSH